MLVVYQNFNTEAVRPVGERRWKGDAMVREGFKVELLQSQALVGGQLKLTGPALVFWHLVVDIGDVDKTWMRLPLEEVGEEPLWKLPVRLSQGIFSISQCHKKSACFFLLSLHLNDCICTHQSLSI